MALPTKTDLVKMDISQYGEPFVHVPAKSTIETKTMDISYNGEPFVTNPDSAGPVNNSNFFAFMPF